MKPVAENYHLKNHNTLGLIAEAQYFLALESREDFNDFANSDLINSQRVLVLGEGSNVVLPEKFNGLVLRPNLKGIEVVEESDSSIVLKVQAGENWHEFVEYTIDHEYFGLENLTLIPGSVGAAPVQNIGAYGVEVKDCILSVEVYNFRERKIENLSIKDCSFSYRDSLFKRRANEYMVLALTFELSKVSKLHLDYQVVKNKFGEKEHVTQRELADFIQSIRKQKLPDPSDLANAGSFFKNPQISNKQYQTLKLAFSNMVAFPASDADDDSWKVSAAWLIESCGWKGRYIKNIGMYAKHALVLVNKGKSSQEDVVEFCSKVKGSVLEKYDIALEVEPVIVEG